MKVLMINVVCGIGSTGRICTDLAEELNRQGHVVKIAYGREKTPEKFGKYAIKIGNNLDVYMHVLKARLLDASGFGSKRATKRFINWVQEFDPDIIHLHNIHGYYINIKVLFDYLKANDKKIIWTFHDCWAFTGHTAYCDAISCKRWINVCKKCPQKHQYPKTFIDNSKRNWLRKKELLCGLNDLTIITPSDWMNQMVRQSFLSKYDSYVIHNGIDLAVFNGQKTNNRIKMNLADKIILLGVAATWDDMKGLTDFKKLSILLDRKYQIIMIGLNKTQLREMPKEIIGIGRTNGREELVMYYQTADIFLNLTYCDNYPTVNLEAVACGTKVISYDVGGCKETIRKGIDQVVPRGDLNAVIKAIHKVIETDETEKIEDIAWLDQKETYKQYLEEYERIYYKIDRGNQKDKYDHIFCSSACCSIRRWDIRK